MHIAISLSCGLSPHGHDLPGELADVEVRAHLVDAVDGLLLVDGQGNAQFDQLGVQVRKMSNRSESLLPSITDQLDRAAIVLRLWAGCLMAAKAIALETRSGPNTAVGRAKDFIEIAARADADRVVCAGVEAAPAFKGRRSEPYALDGVPEGSPVRRFVELR